VRKYRLVEQHLLAELWVLDHDDNGWPVLSLREEMRHQHLSDQVIFICNHLTILVIIIIVLLDWTLKILSSPTQMPVQLRRTLSV
jgi:hypothetical protein